MKTPRAHKIVEPCSAGLDWERIDQNLETEKGQAHWRSLDELSETPEFRDFVAKEFPAQASEWNDDVSRRRFLQLMAASLALAGWTGCTQRQPNEKIVPYVVHPEEIVLGRPLFFATTMTLGGFGTGLLVKCREGRPIKVEGNPDHPFSLGATTVFHQASLLDLYDPARSKAVLQGGEISSWNAFTSDLRALLKKQESKQGGGFRLLTETISSPALTAQIQSLLKKYPKAKWHAYEPVNREQVYEGARLAFDEPMETQYDFDKAEVIVSLDSDFLGNHPGSLRFAQQFIKGRSLQQGQTRMNRLYVIEPQPTVTGSMADHRLPLAAGQIPRIAYALFQSIVGKPNPQGERHAWIQTIAADLQNHKGTSVVIAGDQQPASVHAIAHHINEALGNFGKTVSMTARATPGPWQQTESLRELCDEMRGGRVDLLVVLGGNPAFTSPVDFHFTEALSKVPSVLRLGSQEDETSAYAHWHIPEAHYLESWGDARAQDGTVSFQQPAIDPLYGGKTALELIEAMVAPESGRASYEIVRDYWASTKQWPDFEKGWRKCVHDGLVAGSAFPRKTVPLQSTTDLAGLVKTSKASGSSGKLELVFSPDPTLWDGRFANNAWLQELPKPITKLTWDNAVQISPHTARQLNLSNGDRVEVSSRDRKLIGPCWIVPGQAEGTIGFQFGHGRLRVGPVGLNTGFDAFALRTSNAPWASDDVKLRKAGGHDRLAATQLHQSLEGRDVYRAGNLADLKMVPSSAESPKARPEQSLYNLTAGTVSDAAWGMVIDLNSCIGCAACPRACYAENNIPVVGKDQVLRGREMQWIRVDTYFQGSIHNPKIGNQPVPCMHCETAPCEVVCPVEATVHDHEGLNLQVYNRCIGTRYCSNNCPYKVRRFNFLQYSDRKTPSLQLMYNPEVTVRSRGVMEKCTYCVQRIAAARIEADKENRSIKDGEVTTACAQACPTNAIVFGNLRDPESRVARLKKNPLNYAMLGDLNTFPRTTYLKKVRNPNPAMLEEGNEERYARGA
ncbi:MAG TPA: TAT-variant-translocated molybdopterin oxidoreductase [Candidatus Saccharimonadales bacterium]|nr:TAT-variant-translocated molybdopterin oxidoreductase [Candidatus Saccharimonadales bacterium]